MFYRKEGLPEEGDLVLCTVTRVMHNSVFVRLDEYRTDGMIHISEVSPGRIRNIRDFVKEGKKVVCKVLRVKQERRQVDVSLRRVTDGQRREKISGLKQEQKAEQILTYVAKSLNKEPKEVYKLVTEKVFEDYDDLHSFFQDVVNDESSFSDYDLDKKVRDELEKTVKQRLKPSEVFIKGTLELRSFDSNGVEVIQEALKKADNEGVELKYLGAGSYEIGVRAPDYKQAETIMESSTKAALEFMEDKEGVAKFNRKK